MPAYKLHKGGGKISSFLYRVRRELETNPHLPHLLAQEWATGLAVGAGTFLVFVRTLCPTVYPSEGAELVAAATTLGIPRPTGYPLYLLIGCLLSRLFPDANPAYVMNLFSAAAASAASVVLYALLRSMVGSRIVAAVGAVSLALSLSLWSQATISGVYALNALFCLLCLYYTFAWYRCREDRFIARVALVAGFGLAVHALIVVNVVVMGTLMAMTYRRPLLELPRLARLLSRGLVGLSLYAYLPIRSAVHPALDRGSISTPGEFFRYLFGSGYWERSYVENLSDVWRILAYYVKTIPAELTWLGAALVVAGIVAMASRDRRLLVACLLCFGANLGLMMFHGGQNDVLHWSYYLIPGYIGLIILASYGLQYLCAMLRSRPAMYAAAAVLPILAFLSHYHLADKSRNFVAHDYGFALLRALPFEATLIARSDSVLYPLSYFRYAEGMRSDVRLVVSEGDEPVDLPGGTTGVPTYLTHSMPLRDASLRLVPEGLAYRVMGKDEPWQPEPPESSYRLRYAGDQTVYKDYPTQGLMARFYYMMGVGYAGVDEALAFRLLARASKASGDNAAMHYDLGMAYMSLGVYDPAQVEFERVAAIDPKDRRASARIGQVELLRGRQQPPPTSDRGQLTMYLERARTLSEQGDLTKAVAELQEAVSLNPRSFEAHDALGAAYLKLELYHLAKREWETALRIKPGDPAVLANLSHVGHMMEWRQAPADPGGAGSEP